MPIVVIGLSHRTSPVTLRERFAFSAWKIPEALTKLRQTGVVDEAVILSTCNRVEIYAVTPLEADQAMPAISQFIREFHGFTEPLGEEFYQQAEPAAVEHLFRVACGLDSMVLGETEILGQLKKAYDLALQNHHTGGRLNKAFQRAFNVAKHVRTETNIQRGSISVASASVELAAKIFGTLERHEVMVLGAGDTSEKTARALLSRGAKSIIVANRTYERALALANELGGRAVQYDTWAEEFARVDIVISSTSAPHYVLDRAKLEPLMKARKRRPLLLIDIAVPRDIDPEVNLMENVFLYNVDDLQGIANDYLRQRKAEVERCEIIIREKARALVDGQRHQGAPPHAHAALGQDSVSPA